MVRCPSMLVFFVLALCLSVTSAHATPHTMKFTYSGASWGNMATATGSFTFEDSMIPINSPFSVMFDLPNPAITAFEINILGASSGNGLFTLTDFASLWWRTNGATLDFTQELVGQPTSNRPWGFSSPTEPGAGGDFNLASNGGGAPSGSWFFELTTSNGTGDSMRLTSMTESSDEPIPTPEPSTIVLVGAGLGGIFIMRKRLQR